MKINPFQASMPVIIIFVSLLSVKPNQAIAQKSDHSFSNPVTLQFTDTILGHKSPLFKGETRMKVKSVHVEDGALSFNLGLVDTNADGIYQDPEKDLVVVTNGQGNQVRLNAQYGTPHCKVTDPINLRIDTSSYLLYDIDPGGKTAKLKRVFGQSKADISLKTHCKGVVFQKYAGGEILLDTVIPRKKYTYVYFWVSRKLEYQMKKLENIYAQYGDKVTIIGVHCREREWDDVNQKDFFEVLAKPWNGYSCSNNQYVALNQDYSWYRGLLIQNDGTILWPHISPKELEESLANGNFR
jgi:hypothetical protein